MAHVKFADSECTVPRQKNFKSHSCTKKTSSSLFRFSPVHQTPGNIKEEKVLEKNVPMMKSSPIEKVPPSRNEKRVSARLINMFAAQSI